MTCVPAKFGTAQFGVSKFGDTCQVVVITDDRIYGVKTGLYKRKNDFYSNKSSIYKRKIH